MTRVTRWLVLLGPLVLVIVIARALVVHAGPANDGLFLCTQDPNYGQGFLKVGRDLHLFVAHAERVKIHVGGRGRGPEVANDVDLESCLYALDPQVAARAALPTARYLLNDLSGRWMFIDEGLARVDGWSASKRIVERAAQLPVHALVLGLLFVAPFLILLCRAGRGWLIGYAIALAGLGWLVIPFAKWI